jgi:hypothetical protein
MTENMPVEPVAEPLETVMAVDEVTEHVLNAWMTTPDTKGEETFGEIPPLGSDIETVPLNVFTVAPPRSFAVIVMEKLPPAITEAGTADRSKWSTPEDEMSKELVVADRMPLVTVTASVVGVDGTDIAALDCRTPFENEMPDEGTIEWPATLTLKVACPLYEFIG